jgi:hypothetical protein
MKDITKKDKNKPFQNVTNFIYCEKTFTNQKSINKKKLKGGDIHGVPAA